LKQLKQAEQNLATMTTERSQAKQELAAAQAEFQRLQAEKKSAETELAKANQNLAATQHTLNEKTEEATQLQQEINNLTSSSSAQTQKLNKKLTQLQEELKNTKEHLKTQEDLVAQSSARIQSLETQLNTSNRNLAEKTTALSEANTREQHLQNQVNTLTNNLSEKEREVTTTKARATTAEENARNLQNELNRKKSEIDTLTQQKNDLSGQLAQATQNHQLEKTNLEQELSNTKEKIKQIEASKEKILFEKITAEKNAQKIASTLAKIQKENANFNKAVSSDGVSFEPNVGRFSREPYTSVGDKNKNNYTLLSSRYQLENAGYQVVGRIHPYAGKNIGVLKAEYGGYPTLAKQLNKLTGEATYKGRARAIYLDDTNRNDPLLGPVKTLNTITLSANFTKHQINGVINYTEDNNISDFTKHPNIPETVYLSQTEIRSYSISDNDTTSFFGLAHSEKYKGGYEGMFMGENGSQISGNFRLHRDNPDKPNEFIQIEGAFVAEQQK